MNCRECDFNIELSGRCRGMIKNPAAKVPFYVCPFAAEIEQLEDYYDRPAVERAYPLIPLEGAIIHHHSAHECRPADKF